jgi:hypothetical protein
MIGVKGFDDEAVLIEIVGLRYVFDWRPETTYFSRSVFSVLDGVTIDDALTTLSAGGASGAISNFS